MKLSIDGRFRKAAQAAFVGGLAVASFSVSAQEAAPVAIAAEATPAAAEPAAAAPAPAPVETLPVAEAAPVAPVAKAEKSVATVELKKISVTGSRIKSANLTGTSPVTTVSSQELKDQGTTRVEDLLNSLPQAYADQGGNVNNGSDGTATVNLRNLGAQRTLVLIDGKRTAPGTPGNPNTDLNFIPSALVDRVDVLTGGASAVYGSDAVAGVVNFIMKKDFEGVKIEYQRSGYLHENDQKRYRGFLTDAGITPPSKQKFDGGGNDVSILFGVNTADGKGNATLYATYLQLDPILQDARDFGKCQFNVSGDDSYACGGSSTSFPGRFRLSGPRRDLTVDQGTGEFRAFRSAPGPGTDLYNFAPLNYYQRNDERYSMGGLFHYKFNESLEAYSSVMFADDQTTTLAAPSGSFGRTARIDCDSPLLTPGQKATLCTSRGLTAAGARQTLLIGRRNVEGGPRTQDYDRYQYRIVTGLRGDLDKTWSYDTSIQYSQATYQAAQAGYFSNSRLDNALNVVTVNGRAQCANGGVDGCVPYNIYGVGKVDAAQLSYLNIGSLASGSTNQKIATGSITGSLADYGLKSPIAAEGFGLALGGEYRREVARFTSDETSRSGDLGGAGGASPAINGAFTVKDVFAELNIPLVQNVTGIYNLGLETGFRHSNYSNVSATDTYKLSGEYAPTKDLLIRGGYNRAVRAPSIGNLVQPVTVGIGGTSDPCSGPIDPATGNVTGGATRAQCANDPLIAANPGLYGNIDFDPAGQYNAQSGIDGNLTAEKADTYTAGFVFTPTFVKGFSLTVDYFDIKVNDRIGTRGADNTLKLCYQQGRFCDLIVRNPNQGGAFGTLYGDPAGFTIDRTTNTGFQVATGIDLAVNYRLKLKQLGLPAGAGSMTFDLVGTRSLKQDLQIIESDDSTKTKCNGSYGGVTCGTPNPLWRHKLRASYSVPVTGFNTPVLLGSSAAWRYLTGSDIEEASADGANNIDRHLSAQSYFDLTASATIASKYSLRLGVNNVLDNNPPVIAVSELSATLGNGNTYPQVYDSLGRYLFAAVSMDF